MKRLVHYKNFTTNWSRQNAARMNSASKVLQARGIAFPDANEFRQLRRAEQLDALVTLRDTLPAFPEGTERDALAALFTDMETQVFGLKDWMKEAP